MSDERSSKPKRGEVAAFASSKEIERLGRQVGQAFAASEAVEQLGRQVGQTFAASEALERLSGQMSALVNVAGVAERLQARTSLALVESEALEQLRAKLSFLVASSGAAERLQEQLSLVFVGTEAISQRLQQQISYAFGGAEALSLRGQISAAFVDREFAALTAVNYAFSSQAGRLLARAVVAEAVPELTAASDDIRKAVNSWLEKNWISIVFWYTSGLLIILFCLASASAPQLVDIVNRVMSTPVGLIGIGLAIWLAMQKKS